MGGRSAAFGAAGPVSDASAQASAGCPCRPLGQRSCADQLRRRPPPPSGPGVTRWPARCCLWTGLALVWDTRTAGARRGHARRQGRRRRFTRVRYTRARRRISHPCPCWTVMRPLHGIRSPARHPAGPDRPWQETCPQVW